MAQYACGCVTFIGEVVPCANHRKWVRPAPTLTVEATDPKARAEVEQLRAMVDGLAERVSALAKKESEAQAIIDGGRGIFLGSATLQERIGRARLELEDSLVSSLGGRGRVEKALRILEGRE